MARQSQRSAALGLLFVGAARAQQVYIPGDGLTVAPNTTQPTPTYSFTPFSFTQTETTRTASPVTPDATRITYAPPYASLSHLLDTSVRTTSYGNWDPSQPSATDTDDPYGQASWSAMWADIDLPGFTPSDNGLYSSTVSPTPLPTSELIFPPPAYFGPTEKRPFPSDFMFGVSGSASQIEGAVATEGRGPTLMEYLGVDPATGNLTEGFADNYAANEHYYLYKQDLQRIAAIGGGSSGGAGMRYYSFSVAWSRIFPFAEAGSPANEAGLRHYEDLIDYALELGLVPVVTLLHFDTPLALYGDLNETKSSAPRLGYQNGGYQNPGFREAFVYYGKFLMTRWADRVPLWFTYNEPLLYCQDGVSVDTVVKTHADLWHFYHDEIGGTGKVAIKFNLNFGVPRDPLNPADVAAADHFNAFHVGTFGNPLFIGEDYPDAFKQTASESLVPLTPDDLAYLNGTSDLFGIDPYTATVVSPPADGVSIADCARSNGTHALWPYCVEQGTITSNGWNLGYRSESYVYTTPTYLRSYLNYVWNSWRTPIVISEFGFPVHAEASTEALEDQLYDLPRSEYYLSFMSEVLRAIWDDGVHVAGAYAWSFADNWEFGDYDQHFGVQTVNRTTMERRFKKSLFDLVDFVAERRS